MNSSQQTVWEKIYADGQANMAPWTHAVTFMFSESPKNIPTNEIRILEVGCGTASNIFLQLKWDLELQALILLLPQ